MIPNPPGKANWPAIGCAASAGESGKPDIPPPYLSILPPRRDDQVWRFGDPGGSTAFPTIPDQFLPHGVDQVWRFGDSRASTVFDPILYHFLRPWVDAVCRAGVSRASVAGPVSLCHFSLPRVIQMWPYRAARQSPRGRQEIATGVSPWSWDAPQGPAPAGGGRDQQARHGTTSAAPCGGWPGLGPPSSTG